MKRGLVVLSALVLTMGLSAPAVMADEAADAKEITISLGTETCNGDFDPTQRVSRAYSFFYSTLMTYDQDLQLVKDLAVDYTVSEDSKEYTFILRDDVQFSNGDKMTSADVVFTFEKAKESGAAIDMTKVESIEAPDETTVVFKLSEPSSLFLTDTAFLGIVNAKEWNEAYGLNPIGTGPYKLTELTQDQQMILEKNEYYYGEEPKIDKITVLELSDDVVLAALQAGTVDLASVPATQAGIEIPGYTLLECPTNVTKFIHLFYNEESEDAERGPIGNNVTSDPAVRQALQIGINRQEIVDNVLNGYGRPVYTLITSVAWANTEPEIQDGQIEEACRILEEAGWIDEDGDGFREKDGVPCEFDLNGSADETERYNIAVALAQQAEPLGIRINVTSLSWADCKNNAGYQSTVWSIGNYTPVDVYQYSFSKLGGIKTFNPAYYANETVDEYVNQAITGDPAEANDYWKKVQYDGETGMNVDLPYLCMVNTEDLYYVRDGLNVGEQRTHDHGMGGWSIIYNYADWTLE